MKLVVFALLMSLIACAKSKGDRNTGSLDLPTEELAEVAKGFCEENQTLKLVDSEGLNADALTPAIAVISGNDRCADVVDVDDWWSDEKGHQSRFRAKFPEGCVPNNSVWELTRQATFDGQFSYTYVQVSGEQSITISGHQHVKATYARDHAGIRALRCD